MNYRLQTINLILVLAVILGLARINFAQAENSEKNSIDAAQAQCLKTSRGTMPRARCYSHASDAWQKKVADTYAALLKLLPARSQETLKKGQAAWQEYQSEEEALISSLYPSRGSAFISVRIIEIMKAYKARALELENHIQTVRNRSK